MISIIWCFHCYITWYYKEYYFGEEGSSESESQRWSRRHGQKGGHNQSLEKYILYQLDEYSLMTASHHSLFFFPNRNRIEHNWGLKSINSISLGTIREAISLGQQSTVVIYQMILIVTYEFEHHFCDWNGLAGWNGIRKSHWLFNITTRPFILVYERTSSAMDSSSLERKPWALKILKWTTSSEYQFRKKGKDFVHVIRSNMFTILVRFTTPPLPWDERHACLQGNSAIGRIFLNKPLFHIYPFLTKKELAIIKLNS